MFTSCFGISLQLTHLQCVHEAIGQTDLKMKYGRPNRKMTFKHTGSLDQRGEAVHDMKCSETAK